jgi:hypothetical protein
MMQGVHYDALARQISSPQIINYLEILRQSLNRRSDFPKSRCPVLDSIILFPASNGWFQLQGQASVLAKGADRLGFTINNGILGGNLTIYQWILGVPPFQTNPRTHG